jgi:YidC/Oxa1 family membrane protein insertase
MDRKAIIVVAASVGFIILWSLIIVPKYLTKPLPPGATNSVASAQSAAATNAVTSTPAPPAASNATITASPAGTPVQPFVSSTLEEETLTITDGDARYVFTSHGGGLKRIELTRYPEFVAKGRKTDTNRVASLNSKAPVPVMAILGDASLQGDGVFKLSPIEGGVRAEKELTNGLVIVKDFQATSNYLFDVKVRFENRSASPVNVPSQEWVVGTATPMHAMDKQASMYQGLMWSDGTKTHDTPKSWFDNRGLMSCLGRPSVPRTEYRGGANDVTWVAAHNQFFAIVAMLPTNAPSVVARTVPLPNPTIEELPEGSSGPTAAPVGIQTAVSYPGFPLQAGASFERKVTFYAGPKEYQRLADIAAQQGNNLDNLMSFGFFGFVSKALLLGMNWMHSSLMIGYGIAIILITFVIKMAFWPLTAASTRSMKRMQQLQPQMKALQEKYKDDPAKMNRKLMEFMKENKVSPLGGCLPMVLQIPVFFGFFTMIRSAIELRGAHFLWVSDLSQPDTLFYAAGFPVNLLPLIMGGTMLWQARLTPPSPGMDPAQQKIMKYMPLMFMVFLYNYSAALTLYWTTNNLLTILQTKLTKTRSATAGPAPATSAPARKRKPRNIL